MEKLFVLKRSNSNMKKKNVFNTSITIEGKICHMLDLGTAGFSLPAVVTRMSPENHTRENQEMYLHSGISQVFSGFLV